MPNKQETLSEKEQISVLEQKFEILHVKRAAEKGTEVIKVPANAVELEVQLAEIYEKIPEEPKGFRDELRKIIALSETLEPAKVLALAESAYDIIRDAYMDTRKGMKNMPKRAYVEHVLARYIDEIAGKDVIDVRELHTVGRLNFDMNGLKALNDIGGHASGDKGLEMMATTLKKGATTNWLREQGCEVIASAEGGDEFGMIVRSTNGKDLRPILREAEQRFVAEIKGLDAGGLIDFKSEGAKKHLKEFDINIPEGFKFELGTSVGSSTFGEALMAADFPADATYTTMRKMFVGTTIGIADENAIEQKRVAKEGLKTTNEPLWKLYSRLSPELAAAEKKIAELMAKMAQMEIDAAAKDKIIELKNQMITDLQRENARLKAEALSR